MSYYVFNVWTYKYENNFMTIYELKGQDYFELGFFACFYPSDACVVVDL